MQILFRKRVPEKIWLVSIALIIACFHALNWRSGCSFTSWFEKSRLTFPSNSLLGSVPWIKAKAETARGCSLTYTLSSIGYSARFWSGQRLPMVFKGPSSSELNLYFRDETDLQFPKNAALVERHLVELREFITKVKKKGITIVVLPIPTKVSIERSRIGELVPGKELWTSPISRGEEDSSIIYKSVLSMDRDSTVDLLTAFSSQNGDKSTPDRLYVPWDYHWSRYGMAVAAVAALKNLDKQGIRTTVQKPMRMNANSPIANEAYIVWHQLPDWYITERTGFSWKEYTYLIRGHLVSKWNGRLFIGGTSFMNRLLGQPDDFVSMIENVLARKAIVHAVPGGNTDTSMKRIWEEKIPPTRGDIIFWEFPIATLSEEKISLPVLY